MWFLLIPPVAVLLSIAWIALRSRPVRTSEAMITIEGYRRSMAALARPIPDQPEVRSGVSADGHDADDHDLVGLVAHTALPTHSDQVDRSAVEHADRPSWSEVT